jgi:hypothetical protein
MKRTRILNGTLSALLLGSVTLAQAPVPAAKARMFLVESLPKTQAPIARNSNDTTDPNWWNDSPYLTQEAAAWVVAKKPSVVGFDFAQEEKGTDYQKADQILDSAMRVHRTILPKVTFQIENLINLDQIGRYPVDLAVDDDRVEPLLAAEVLVHDRLGDAGALGDLFDRRRLVASLREHRTTDLHELRPPRRGGEPRAGRCGGVFSSHVDTLTTVA